MPRPITPSQLRSKLQRTKTRQNQAIQKLQSEYSRYNSKVRQHNSKVKRELDAYNRNVRTNNSRARNNRTRLQSALQQLSGQTINIRYALLHQSVSALSNSYALLDTSEADPFLTDLAERDTANSVTVLNNLLGVNDNAQNFQTELKGTKIGNSLERVSLDLSRRWEGAIFAFDPRNPDATRHFCSSSREIISGLLDFLAPNADVLKHYPDSRDKFGNPIRRARIRYCLEQSGKSNNYLGNFLDTDINDLTCLFRDLSAEVHGPSGVLSMSQLAAIKTRVEDAIDLFMEFTL